MSTSRFVEANGIRLHYLDHGGDGPTLVLTHGLSATAHWADGLVAAGLVPACRVLSFDLRGRGLSDRPETGYTMDDHAADLVGALDALELDRVLLGGHSFGGLLTMYVAATAPARVERALVLDVPAEADPAVLEQIRPSLSRHDHVFPSRAAHLDFVRSLPFLGEGDWTDDLAAYYASEVEELADGSVRSHCRPDHILQAAEGTYAPDWADVATRVECPTLLVRSVDPFGAPGAGPIMTAEGAARMLARLRDGRLLEAAGNHVTFVFGDRARALVPELVAFLDPVALPA
jgi:pimeloyl-ACP methyl ester carboxylesterase